MATTSPEPARRRGPRPAGEDTRSAIVEAARGEFAARGYDGTTLRGIARAAGVDPRLVHHYFEGKQAVFQAVLQLPVPITEVIERVFSGDGDDLAERVLRTFFTVWDAPGASERLVAFLAASTTGSSARTMQQFLTHEILTRIGRFAEDDDPQLRASLAASQMLGVAMARYVLRIEPLASAEPDDLIPFLAPTLQRYLKGQPN
jgi:AcrR family transcriptional regulator